MVLDYAMRTHQKVDTAFNWSSRDGQLTACEISKYRDFNRLLFYQIREEEKKNHRKKNLKNAAG